jgi:hypothetical protein
MKLNQYIDQLEQNCKLYATINKNVSSKGVDWHIDHSLKVFNNVVFSLKESNPADFKWKFNFLRSYILCLGKIPRGKAKAPKAVNNLKSISIEELHQQINEAKKYVLELPTFHKKSNFNHPYFGVLNLRMTILFLEIHTHHHLKIIKDIVK